jgi:hypothetical protein
VECSYHATLQQIRLADSQPFPPGLPALDEPAVINCLLCVCCHIAVVFVTCAAQKFFRAGGTTARDTPDVATIRPFHAPTTCLDVYFASDANGAVIALNSCHNGLNQQWAIAPTGQDKSQSVMPFSVNDPLTFNAVSLKRSVAVRSSMHHFCITRPANSTPDIQLVMQPCNGGANQLWTTALGPWVNPTMRSVGDAKSSTTWCATATGPENGEGCCWGLRLI